MEGILALMIPVLALATGFVAVLRMPPESFGGKKGKIAPPAADNGALLEEVAMLREELAQIRERVDFTERLLMDGTPAQRLAIPAPAVRAEQGRMDARVSPAPSLQHGA